ncbi:hypothetical protein MP638_003844 [Amoeboaphelidium occidentale]|nr:hypothetical protein MP638_003844 [Amoeboaphelidium occidentale]
MFDPAVVYSSRLETLYEKYQNDSKQVAGEYETLRQRFREDNVEFYDGKTVPAILATLNTFNNLDSLDHDVLLDELDRYQSDTYIHVKKEEQKDFIKAFDHILELTKGCDGFYRNLVWSKKNSEYLKRSGEGKELIDSAMASVLKHQENIAELARNLKQYESTLGRDSLPDKS